MIMSKSILVFFAVLFIACNARGDIVSKESMDSAISTKVSTEQSATQTLQGHYTVTGTFEVETPAFPPALN